MISARRVLCLLLLLAVSAQGRDQESSDLSSVHRNLFDIWTMFFSLGHHCPEHGPLSHHCHSSGSDGGSSSSGSSSSSSGGASAYEESATPDSSRLPGGRVSSFAWWMVAAAAAAAVVAGSAIMMAQRKQPKEIHPLKGSVARRMQLFGNFADSALCGTTDRPDRVVEMTMSADDYDMVA